MTLTFESQLLRRLFIENGPVNEWQISTLANFNAPHDRSSHAHGHETAHPQLLRELQVSYL